MESNAPAQDYRHADFLKLFKPKGSQDKVSLALIGLGRAGSIHLGNLMTNTRIVLKYIVEELPARRVEIQKLLGPASLTKLVGTDQLDVILKDKDLDGVLITTPTHTHTDIIIKALDNKKAVFSEKPIAESYEGTKQCYKKAKEAGLILHCGFQRRFDPSYGTLAKRVQAGEIGQVRVIKSVARDSPGGIGGPEGIFHCSLVHDLDMICYTLGAFPKQIFATAVSHTKGGDYDTAAVQMIFPDDTLGMIDFSNFSVYGYDQRLEAFGTGGMLQCNNQPTLGISAFKSEGVQDAPICYSFPSRFEAAYKREIDHFVDVIQGKAELSVTAQQILNISKIATAAEESAKTGLPVDIVYDN